MTDQNSDVRDFLRPFMIRIEDKLDRLVSDIGDLKLRMTAMEADSARVQTSLALINARLDRVETRLDRIERRLELVEAAPPDAPASPPAPAPH